MCGCPWLLFASSTVKCRAGLVRVASSLGKPWFEIAWASALSPQCTPAMRCQPPHSLFCAVSPDQVIHYTTYESSHLEIAFRYRDWLISAVPSSFTFTLSPGESIVSHRWLESARTALLPLLQVLSPGRPAALSFHDQSQGLVFPSYRSISSYSSALSHYSQGGHKLVPWLSIPRSALRSHPLISHVKPPSLSSCGQGTLYRDVEISSPC